MMGEWGTGGPAIAILGEYDALPEPGQEPGLAEECPLGNAGHGCGHNLPGSAAMLAAVALRDWLAATRRDLFARPDLLAAARAGHAAHLACEPCRCPMPPEVMPPIRPAPERCDQRPSTSAMSYSPGLRSSPQSAALSAPRA